MDSQKIENIIHVPPTVSSSWSPQFDCYAHIHTYGIIPTLMAISGEPG